MSQNSSLKISSRSKRHRSVFKRFERIRMLIKQGRWNEDADSAYGLPKVKSIKIKIKKEKAAEAPAEAALQEGQAQAAVATPKKPAEESKGPPAGRAGKAAASPEKGRDKEGKGPPDR